MSDDEDVKQQTLDLGLESLDRQLVPRVRGFFIAPKVFLASALFTTNNPRKARKHFKDKEIAVAPGFGSLKYRGEELRYNDMRVWQTIIEQSRINEIHKHDHTLTTSIYELLSQIGWKTGGRNYAMIKESLQRLKANSVSVVTEDHEFSLSVSLIARVTMDKNKIEIRLDPEIYKLFQKNTALLSSKELNDIPDIARKIYEVVMTDPLGPLTVTEWIALSGNEYKELRKFRTNLRIALKQLKAGSFIESWEIDKDDFVHIKLSEHSQKTQKMIDVTPT